MGTDPEPRKRGRPRKHATPAARTHAYRLRKGLSKVTVDVPAMFVGEVRDYAYELRRIKQIRLEEFKSKNVARWIESKIIKGTFHRLKIGWLVAEVYPRTSNFAGAPQTTRDLAMCEWRIVNTSEKSGELAGGFSPGEAAAKQICETILSSYIAYLKQIAMAKDTPSDE
jgi:hypothetical protein